MKQFNGMKCNDLKFLKQAMLKIQYRICKVHLHRHWLMDIVFPLSG
jgi:hypothetical protein